MACMWKLKATGCIMAKCKKCNVEILDETEFCPLCHSVLEATDALEDMYPDIRFRMRKRILFSRIFLFCGILAELALILINALCASTIWWSAITGLGILYSYMVFRYAIIGRSGYRSKMIVLTMIGIASIISIDFVIGYRGWSVDYVLPAAILLMDAGILFCVIYNRRNWQSYILWQFAMILCNLIPMLLNIFELENNRFIAFAPFAASTILFMGTMILGGRRAVVELKRRFHVN